MREMKDSGAAFIGHVPMSWHTDKVKYHLERYEVRNPGDQQILSVYREYGVIPKDSRDDNHNVTSEDTTKYKYVKPGYFVINKMKAWQGSMGVSDHEGVVSPAYFIYRFRDDLFNKRYFHYLLRGCYKDEFRRLSGGIREGQWDLPSQAFENTIVLVPNILEQQAIVAFLDSKCAEIDALSADIQSEIDTLEAYKRSVITEAVTKGLDKTVPMKDSGIEWVGQIPADWNLVPIRAVFEEVTDKNFDGSVKNALKFTYGEIVPKTNFEADDDDYVANTILNYTVVEPGTIMLNGLNLNFDFVSQRIGLVKNKGVITSAYMAFKPLGDRVSSEFATYLFKAYDGCKALHNMGGGVRKILNFSEFKRYYVCFPTRFEQQAIVAFLDSKCAEIDSIIAQKQEQLAVLADYKKSVIYEYVTGKKEVPVA